MKFLLAALNTKYIHSNPGIYSLYSYSVKKQPSLAEYIEIAEYTINNTKRRGSCGLREGRMRFFYNRVYCHPLGKDHAPLLRSRASGGRKAMPSARPPEEAGETEQQLKCYADFLENVLAIPIIPQQDQKKKIAGAEATYTRRVHNKGPARRCGARPAATWR